MITLAATEGSNILSVKASGKLTKENYEEFGPKVEALIHQHGKIRVLIELEDFHGWSAGALWEDIKFDVKHFRDIERLALVGEKKWEKGMATFCKPFTTAEVRYFDRAQVDDAREWIAS
jgi:hypothetical protein